MKTKESRRYVALNNMYGLSVPACNKALIHKNLIVRLHKHVKGKYIVRCYHCSQLFQDFLIGEDQFERNFKQLNRAETMLDLQNEFRTNIESANGI